MAKQHFGLLALILSGSALFAACSSTDVKSLGGDNAEAGSSGDSGDNGDAGAPPSMPTALNPQAVVVPADPPPTLGHILTAGSDYKTKTEISSLNLGTGKVDTSEEYSDGDAIAVSSAGLGFSLERTNDRAYLLDLGKVKTKFNLRETGVSGATATNKAYVPFLGKSAIAILDLDEGKVASRIDLSEFDVASDGDKSVDVAGGVYDPTQKIAYFVLQRIDRTTVSEAPFQLACPEAKGLIIGVDPASDELVDLNGASPGKAIELSLVSQNSLSVNADGTALYMLASGCYKDGTLKNQGVEVVDLTDGTTTVAYAPKSEDYLGSLILTTGSEALLESADSNFVTHWNRLDLTNGTLIGKELKNVPQAPSFDGKDLLGVKTSADTYGVLVRYDISTDTAVEISDPLWAGKYGTAVSSALVK